MWMTKFSNLFPFPYVYTYIHTLSFLYLNEVKERRVDFKILDIYNKIIFVNFFLRSSLQIFITQCQYPLHNISLSWNNHHDFGFMFSQVVRRQVKFTWPKVSSHYQDPNWCLNICRVIGRKDKSWDSLFVWRIHWNWS